MLDNPVSRFINGNTVAYVIYGITMAGVFEECGRYIILRYIMKRERTRENVVMYGIGHGGIEVLTITLPVAALYLVIAVLFSAGNIPAVLETLNITQESAAAALPSVMAALTFGANSLASFTVERVMAMLIHIGLTVIVYYAVCTGEKNYLLLAVLLHMVADAFAALYQRAVVSAWVSELWFLLWTVLIVVTARKLYLKCPSTPESAE